MQTIELALNCMKRPFRKFTICFASDPTMKTAGFSDRIWKRWNGAPNWHRPKIVAGCCGSHGPIYDLHLKYISIYSLVLFFFWGLYSHLRLAKGIFDDILHDFDIGKPKRKTRKQRLGCLLCIRLQHLGTEPSHFGSYGEDLCKGNRIVRFSPFWEYICPFSPYNYKWYPIIPAFSMVNSPKNFHFGWLSITRNPLRGTLWRRQVDGFRCVSWMVKSERSPKFVNLRCPESIIYTLRLFDIYGIYGKWSIGIRDLWWFTVLENGDFP